MNVQRLNLAQTERTTGKKFGVMALLGLMLIPAVLAASFQWTQADATENLDRLDAAVVNLDQPVTVDGRFVPLGRLLAMRLTDDDLPVNINWTLTDEEDAADGLADGRFATVVRIPETFSADATSVSAMDPDALRKGILDVQTSQSAGVIDPTIGQAISVAITYALNSELSGEFLENIFLQFGDVRKELGRAVDGSGRLADGLDQAYDGSQSLVEGLAELAFGADRVADGNAELAAGLGIMRNRTKNLPAQVQRLTDGGHQLADGLNQLNDGVSTYSAQIRQLLELLSEVSAKTGPQQRQLEAALVQLEALDAEVDRGVQACQPPEVRDLPVCQIVTGLGGQLDRVQSDLGLASYGELLDALLVAIKDVDYYAQQADSLVTGINKLAWGGNRLAAGLDRLNAGVPELVDGIAKASAGADRLAVGSRQVADGAAYAAGQAQQLPEGLGRLAAGAGELNAGLAAGMEQVPDFTEEERAAMADAIASPVEPVNPQLPNPDLSAGYFTALALAIAALVVFMLIRAVPAAAMSSNLNAFKLTMLAYWPAAVIALLQTLMVALALQIALELPLSKLLAFSGVVLVAALCMAAVSQALVAALGGGGRFVALFAIAVSAPTALISTTPEALQTLINLTPIAPTISALRGVITGANIGAELTGLLVWGVLAIVVTVIAITNQRQVSVRALTRLA